MLRVLAGFLRRFGADRRGGFATTAAICTPVAAVLVAGAIDLAAVNASKATLQAASDAAAIDAARQMTITGLAGLDQRTAANVQGQLTGNTDFTYNVTTVADDDPASVTVTIAANRQSFFANLMPPGGWNITVTSTAVAMGQMPLCVLSTGESGGDTFNMRDTSRITAPGCLVHANSDIDVNSAAALSAGVVQASGLASGPISPTAQTDAPAIEDPFASMNLAALLPLCLPVTTILANTTTTLLPGIHCGNIEIGQGANVTLLPGEHYFLRGHLQLRNNAVLSGDNVVLIFDENSQFLFQESATIALRGRRTGQYAGFVIATTRNNNNTFEINAQNARELLGTVYIPNATLRIGGNRAIADQSAWTVIVARSMRFDGAPNLVINSNYASSTVPVPGGVGPNAANANVRLAQ